MSDKESEAETSITGHVIDEKERPVGGAKVTCNGVETRTLFDGSYKFEGLAPDLHIVEIALEGYRRQRVQIETEEAGETVMDFHLEPKTGDAKIYGYVLDEVTKEPVRAGGSVYMFRLTSNRNMPIDSKTGYFEFINLSPGTYTIWTSVLEYDAKKKTVIVKKGEGLREDFLIRKAEIEPPLG